MQKRDINFKSITLKILEIFGTKITAAIARLANGFIGMLKNNSPKWNDILRFQLDKFVYEGWIEHFGLK